MSGDLKRFKSRALSRPEVRTAYRELDDEFSLLEEMLKARSTAGLTQAEVAQRTGTTQSAIARLESGASAHSPSVATLRRYAKALGYRLEIRLVKPRKPNHR